MWREIEYNREHTIFFEDCLHHPLLEKIKEKTIENKQAAQKNLYIKETSTSQEVLPILKSLLPRAMKNLSFPRLTLTLSEQPIHNKMGKDTLVSFPEADIKNSVSESQSTEPEIQGAIKEFKDVAEELADQKQNIALLK